MKIRERWFEAGSPASVITNTYPVVTPQAVQPLLAKAREIRKKVLDTFPTLKYLLEGQ